ncbi:CDP-alcohol phosphatidyltransferase family protein [Nocardioides humilatus]|uniref:CDP-alcohol phosphatidyltransferase family protein n=1 Tax=Nocardioides humilatus TaxID=2607660 RepID=UPI00165FC943|nr:CDP-alcohol phosphatidyltransferase family protein [Nocardioides humilatus]
MDLVHAGAVGWTVALLCGAAAAALLAGALARHQVALGPAGRITSVRAALACSVAGLTAASYLGSDHAVLVVSIATVGLVLDGVDGHVARRTGTETALGARFDMEVDAFLIAVLSLYVAPTAGWWVLAIGAMRYLYVAAGWRLTWLLRPLPPRYSAKVVAVVQAVVLVVAASELLPAVLTQVTLAVALALLVHSFGHDVRVLWRQREEPLPVTEGALGGPLVPAGAVTAAAAVALWVALVGDPFRIPVEGLVLVAAALVLPPAIRRWAAAGFGALAGVLVVLRITNVGFDRVLDRPFDLLGDWSYFGSGVGVLGDSIGDLAARLVAVGAVVLVVVVVVGLALAAVRVARSAAEHRRESARGVVALAAVWAVLAVTGSHAASLSAAGLAVDTVDQVRAGFADKGEFADEIEQDAFADTPADELLTGLRGKDVLLVFIESYGRTATHGSSYSPGVVDVLRQSTRQLDAAGYRMRTGFLTSPTFGAASWLAHSTTQSGLWVDSERRYGQLQDSDRLTLTSAFERAGWRTVFDVPANTRDWPEGAAFYGYDEIYDSRNVDYRGPEFGYAPVPDQYTLAHFRNTELAAQDRKPVFAEIDLISSHHPWTPPPPLVPWDEVGDGSVFDGTTEDVSAVDEAQDPDLVKELYGRSIQYSWQTLVSWLTVDPDPDRVLIVLGDHEPHSYVSGDADYPGGHDVPISVITQDPAVARRIASWQWEPGLSPSQDAPVWPMSDLRDRILTTFGPRG